MTTYFLDSSALIKRYIEEQGSTWIRTITASSADNSLLIALITPVEILSGAFRRRREGSVTHRAIQAIRLLLLRHVRREYRTVQLTASVLARAEYLLERYPLRAYDAIQLASALEGQAMLATAGLPTLIFVSSDTRLLAAATAEKLAIADPNTQP